MEYVSHSSEDTRRIAAEAAAGIPGGTLVLLEGGLGAGKTTFAQGLAEAFGVREPVRSPTFAVMNVHPADRAEVRHFVHADFYRFAKPEEALEVGLDEWLDRPDAVVVAEWPSMAGEYLGARNVVRVRFEGEGDDLRRIAVS